MSKICRITSGTGASTGSPIGSNVNDAAFLGEQTLAEQKRKEYNSKYGPEKACHGVLTFY